MKTNHIANLKVKDYPGIIKAVNPLTEEDFQLMRSIWSGNIQFCEKNKLKVAEEWLEEIEGHEVGFYRFCAFFAGHRHALRRLHNLNRGDRGKSIEMLQWRYTQGPKAGFYAENISYMIPVGTIDPKTGLYDYSEHPNDRVKVFDLESFVKGSDTEHEKVKRITRKKSFTYQMWEKKKSKLVIPTIHNIPSSIACVILERTGRKVKVTKAIKDKGGHPYNGLLWLRKNPGKTIDDAVEHTVKELAQIVKKKGNNYEDSVKDLAKSFDKVPESVIRQIMMDLFSEEGDDFSIEKVEKRLKRKNDRAVSCTVWKTAREKTEFESVEIAADKIGVSKASVLKAISRGTKTGNDYWVTRGEVPQALKPEFEHIIDMEKLAQNLHILNKAVMSPTEEKILNQRMIGTSLPLIAKKLNLKEEVVTVMLDDLMVRMKERFELLDALTQNTSSKMDSLSADSKERSSKLAKGESLSKDGDGFIAYPDEGISKFTVGTTGASNVNKSGVKKDDDVKSNK